MRRVLVACAAVTVAVASCGSPSSEAPSESESAEMMALALSHLLTDDNTFGVGPPPFSEYLIQTETVPIAGVPDPDDPDSSGTTANAPRALTDAERLAIESAIAAFGPVRWIDDPDDWISDDLEPEIEGMAILGVDRPVLDGDGALVPVSLWCGGLCGAWLTYRLELIEGAWTVTGIEGPVSIA